MSTKDKVLDILKKNEKYFILTMSREDYDSKEQGDVVITTNFDREKILEVLKVTIRDMENGDAIEADVNESDELLMHKTLRNMERSGGSFVKNLVQLYRSGDLKNKAFLEKAYKSLFDKYRNF